MLSQIEQDVEREAIQISRKNVKRIIVSAIAAYAPRAWERQIEVTLESGDKIMVKANPRLLEQAVGNLLDNAIKYSEQGKKIAVVAAANDEDVSIKVIDQGYGIPHEHLPRLFERFYRVDKGRSRAMGGTGLGLAIVKHIIQAHGGRVTVESTLGKGSVFTLHLPKQ
jgi:two-component system phosphate regulon sensor histidine kinase PhoR